MGNGSAVSHEGVVERITGDLIRVRFIAHSACAACHAKGVCAVSGSEEKYVDVLNGSSGYAVGDRVEVMLEEKQGFRALAYGYVFPLVILLVVLFILSELTGREGFSALIAIGSLVPYYFIVWLCRKRLSGKFDFRIQKTNN